MKVVEGLSGRAHEQGYGIVASRGPAIVGVSLGNSYFNRENIKELLEVSQKTFFPVTVMIPWIPMEHTLRAQGKGDGAVASTVMRQQAKLLRFCRESEANFLYDDWAVMMHDPQYESHLSQMHEMFNHNTAFQEDIAKATQQVIGTEDRARTLVGVNFLIEELAFLDAAPEMNGKPQAYVYHDAFPVLERLVEGAYDGRPREKLGIVQIRR